ncbi:HNH endonuclease [Stigmatella hybrida]|uniref:HNH endonuclease n=1 Tax=Stigmatella hybrida TaxID=394097 RepID=UPI001CDAA27C|nr:HNH endonuclease signature motif containing protein [Stigmatella hybrida]
MHWLPALILLTLVPLPVEAKEAEHRPDAPLADTAAPVPVDFLGLAPPSMDLAPEVVAGKRPGSRFTKKDKEIVKQDNASRNGGKTVCETCGVETVPADQHKKGITPPANETHVDHVIPKAKGGAGDPDNGQVLCRDCNIKKGDKEQ